MPRRVNALAQKAITEKEFQRQVLDIAVQYHWHVPSRDLPDDFDLPGIAYHPQWSMGSERGWPDLTLIRMRGVHRRIVLAELKTATGKLTPRQAQVLRLLRELSGTWMIANDPSHATLRVDVHVWRPDDLPTIAQVLA